jgi:class 3 adenylate cyclase
MGRRLSHRVNCGPAMAAVVGRHRFTYDIWSDTVNTASRMESSSKADAHIRAPWASRN